MLHLAHIQDDRERKVLHRESRLGARDLQAEHRRWLTGGSLPVRGADVFRAWPS